MRRLDLTEEQLFGAGGLIADRDGDGFPEAWSGWIALPRTGPARVYAAAAEIAVRAGQDLVALSGPASCFQDQLDAGNQPSAEGRDCYVSLSEADQARLAGLVRHTCADQPGQRSTLSGVPPTPPASGSPGLDAFWSSDFLGRADGGGQEDAFFPVGHRLAIWVPDGEMSGETGKALVELAARYGLESAGLEYPVVFVGQEVIPDGRPVLRVTDRGDLPGSEARLVAPGVVEAGAAGLRWLAEAPAPSDPVTWAAESPPPRRDGPLVAEGHADWPWELEEVQALFEQEVLPRVAAAMAPEKAGKAVPLSPGPVVEVEARVSESPDLRRGLEERWRKALMDTGVAAGRLRVRVRSAYKQGLSWVMEEVAPAVRDLAGRAAAAEVAFRGFEAPEGEKWLELPTRWLQELYPADEILAGALGLPWDKVRFVRSETGPTYQITITGRADAPGGTGEVLYQDSFEARAAERFYLDAFPEAGKVHPPTGLLRWNVRTAAGEEGRPAVASGASGEVRVATDTERFWGYFQKEILPAVTRYVMDGSRAQPLFRRLDLHAWMSEPDDPLGVRQERLSPLEALHEDIYFVALDHFAHLGRSLVGTPYRSPGLIIPWVHRDEGRGPRCQFTLWGWDDRTPEPDERARGRERPAARAQRPGGEGPFPMDQVIGRRRLEDALQALEKRPGVRVHRAGWSFLGEPSYMVEVCLPASGRISRPKLSLLKPTYVLVARHHANEVSSTNSALKLAELLTGDDQRYGGYRRAVNLVIIPCENVDGTALHYELQREHPTWKLHAGRFNAAGQDVAAEYWKEGSAFGESAMLPQVWKAWLPDMMGDDHGVPSHEWEQPFSGYVCPWFSSFWLPRAHFYGYLSYLQDQEERGGVGDKAETGGKYAAHRALVEEVRERLAAAINGDGDIAGLNRVWRDRYQKYGTAWLPDRFPAKEDDFYRDVLIYWTGIKPAENARNLAARHPDITALAWVAEVNDETAQGDYLELCARAHLLADLAVLDVMVAADRREVGVEAVQAGTGGGGVKRVWRRPRPLRLV